MRLRGRSQRLRALTAPIHELRGALSALELGLTTLARQRGANDEHHVDALRLQLRRASSALCDIDLLRGASHAGDPRAVRAQRIDLAEVVPARARSWARLAPAYGATFAVDWRAGRALVDADPRQLEQALDNLISNALEHGGGRVLVEGELRGAMVRVAVSDGGPGPRRLPERDRRPSRQRRLRGHGLGIAVDGVAAAGGKTILAVGANGPAVVLELGIAPSAWMGRARRRSSASPIGEIAAGARRAA
jgi:signal transduction histidine kinase